MPKRDREVEDREEGLKKAAKKAEKKDYQTRRVDRSDIKGTTFTT